jgi:hypothetical protein
MKRLIIAAALALMPFAVFAADELKATPPAQTVKVDMTIDNLKVALFAVANAGSACDNGVPIYCQVAAANARQDTIAKLQAAINILTPPPPTTKP